MTGYIVSYSPDPLGGEVREIMVRATNMPQAFELVDTKLRLQWPCYELMNIRPVYQVQLPPLPPDALAEKNRETWAAIERVRSER